LHSWPSATVIDASGTDSAVFSSNYVAEGLTGVVIDNNRFYDGGTISTAFSSPGANDY
jgi:hypothetical protein